MDAAFYCLLCRKPFHLELENDVQLEIACPVCGGIAARLNQKSHAIDLQPRPETYFQDKTFIPKFAAQDILKELEIVTPTKGEPHAYDSQTGTYFPAKAFIFYILQNRMGKAARKKHLEETLHYIAVETNRAPEELVTPKNLLLLKNGLLNTETLKFETFDSKYFFLNAIRVEYQPEAICPVIEKFLEDTIGKENATIFYELAGYCLWREMPIHKAFMFNGAGSNGKTTTLNILRAFLGKENLAEVPIQSFGGNRFAAGVLENKLANICGDLPKAGLRDTGIFKMLTGGDSVMAEKKYAHPTTFYNYAKMIFSANQLPAVTDDTTAFWRRWTIISFNKTFLRKTADTKLTQKLTTPEELSGLLNKALEYLPLLLERGEFSHSQDTETTRRNYIRASDPVGAFNLEMIVEDANAFVPKPTLYNAFVEYCNHNGMIATQTAVFAQRLRALRPLEDEQKTVDAKRVRVWLGIRLKRNGEDEPVDSDEYDGGSITPLPTKLADFPEN